VDKAVAAASPSVEQVAKRATRNSWEDVEAVLARRKKLTILSTTPY
jgi:hypothetical protein